jgi:hypothetical protein
MNTDRYLPASLRGVNAAEVEEILVSSERSEKPSAFKALVNDGPLSPAFIDALHGRGEAAKSAPKLASDKERLFQYEGPE